MLDLVPTARVAIGLYREPETFRSWVFFKA
jgi:hypothetical protein